MTEKKRGRPKKGSLEEAKEHFDAFEKSVDELTLDKMKEAKKVDVEPQTEISQEEILKKKDNYLKPLRSISSRECFNEKWRKRYEFDKEYVQFIAENREIGGEAIELWTKPYPGLPAQHWRVPVNTPVWGPRFLAEQIRRKTYHRLKTENKVTGDNEFGQDFGLMVVDHEIPRLTAEPVTSNRSIFMGANSF